jgi:hypothetical protein
MDGSLLTPRRKHGRGQLFSSCSPSKPLPVVSGWSLLRHCLEESIDRLSRESETGMHQLGQH